MHPIKEFILLQKTTVKVVLLPIGKTLKDVLSGFEISPQAADQKSIDDFLERFSLGAEQAGLHPEFGAAQLSLIPKRYRRLKTSDPGTIYRGESEHLPIRDNFQAPTRIPPLLQLSR